MYEECAVGVEVENDPLFQELFSVAAGHPEAAALLRALSAFSYQKL
jgi:hypothetical protein